MDTLVKKIDAWGETHREQNSVTADSAGEEDAEEEHVRKRARHNETACAGRMPTIGDMVVALNGRLTGSRFGHWWLAGGEMAIVEWVDADRDFKLINVRGHVSPLMYFAYNTVRMPIVGDVAVSKDGQAGMSRDGQWRLEVNELALVLRVDNDGDLQLVNLRGQISPIMFRELFSYNTQRWT